MNQENYNMIVELYTMIGILFGLTSDSIIKVSMFWWIATAVFMVLASVYVLRAYVRLHFPEES